MKKSTKRLLFVVGASVAAMYAYNKFVEITATNKNLLSDEGGDYFSFRDYNIFYTKTGSGSPILLIHDTDATACMEEYHKLVRRLERTHTVYCLDLLGCGRSDKPALEYTNYLYVELITAFVKEVIGNTTTVT